MGLRKLAVLNVAALSPRDITVDTPSFNGLALDGGLSPLIPPDPSLTCPSHATMITGLSPREHGIVANGWYDQAQGKVLNWGRSDGLVSGEKIWDTLRKAHPSARVANLFWRFCTHSECDLTLTERPTYFSNGRKGADVYASDPTFKRLCVETLGPFPFFHFWGPKACLRSSEWILDAARLAMEHVEPDLLLCYAPGLDYDVQRFGPSAPATRQTLIEGDAMYGEFIAELSARGYDVAVVSDYGFVDVDAPVFPNRVLRAAGHLAVDDAANGEWLEPAASDAFAVCDNQVAHVYLKDKANALSIKRLLLETEGIRDVLTPNETEALGHDRAGDLLAIADSNRWFAYPYWLDAERAPDFSRCVDIFNKPGFDPAELFLREGFLGAMHAAKRFLQLKTQIRAPFDVITTRYERVRGSRAIRPTDTQQQAVLLTSWARDDDAVDMVDLKSLLLARMMGTSS